MRSAINRDNGATLSDWRDERNTRSLWDSAFFKLLAFGGVMWFVAQFIKGF